MNKIWWISGLIALGYGLGSELAAAKPLPIIGNISTQDAKAFENVTGCTFSRKVGGGKVFVWPHLLVMLAQLPTTMPKLQC